MLYNFIGTLGFIRLSFPVLIIIFCVKDKFVLSGEPLFFFIEHPEKLSYTYEIRASETVGAKFPREPLKHVALHYAQPSHACTPIIPITDAAVLIERGGCSFTTKAVNAGKSGAILALITDSASGSGLWIDMIGDNSGQISNIPVAFLPGVSGKKIRDYLMYGNDEVRLTIPLNYSIYDAKILQTKPPWELW